MILEPLKHYSIYNKLELFLLLLASSSKYHKKIHMHGIPMDLFPHKKEYISKTYLSLVYAAYVNPIYGSNQRGWERS